MTSSFLSTDKERTEVLCVGEGALSCHLFSNYDSVAHLLDSSWVNHLSFVCLNVAICRVGFTVSLQVEMPTGVGALFREHAWEMVSNIRNRRM